MAKEETDSRAGGWALPGLAADGPCPELEEQLATFGQFVGDWEISEWRNLEKDGTWSTGRGELHWRWILDGRAVQDIWSTYDERSGRMVPLGTTLRFYDPKIDAWQSVWISPVNHVARPFVGRRAGSEIVLDGKSARGAPIRWIFSEISGQSFRWRAEEFQSETSAWTMNEEMRIRRMPKAPA